MAGPIDVQTAGATTNVVGRFVVSGERFQLVTDASRANGGQGEAIGATQLLAASLVTCALNIFRGAIEPDLPGSREVLINSRLHKGEGDQGLGHLDLDVRIGGVNAVEAERLRQLYVENCSIYAALKDVLAVTISAQPA